ncbi:MAG: DUF418 domain-containing protein [Phycisphaerales bacterium]
MSLETPAVLRPTQAGDRIAALDVARGLALFGIFMVNIQLMTQPLRWLIEGGGAGEGSLGLFFHYLTRVFFESKSYPLFSMLFGMGLVLMYDRSRAAGRAFAPTYLRRLLLLLLFGMAHAWLVWYGDILIYYACFGVVLMWFAPFRPRTMLIIAAVLAGVSAAWASGLNLLFVSFAGGAEPPVGPEVAGFEDFRRAFFAGEIQGGPELPAWGIAETDAMANGPFWNAVQMRLLNWTTGTIFWMLLFAVVLHVPAMFLLGAAIFRSGALTDPGSPWPKRFMLLGLLVGLPGSIGAVVLSEIDGPMSASAAIAAGVVHLFGPLVSIGYLGVAVWLARAGVGRRLVQAVASAGRMALTNYLLQSLLVAALAQHWGLGWFGDVSRAGMVWIVLSIYAAQLVFSTLWLRWFAMGPFEYLWRSWTYLRLPRLRRATPSAGEGC